MVILLGVVMVLTPVGSAGTWRGIGLNALASAPSTESSSVMAVEAVRTLQPNMMNGSDVKMAMSFRDGGDGGCR